MGAGNCEGAAISKVSTLVWSTITLHGKTRLDRHDREALISLALVWR